MRLTCVVDVSGDGYLDGVDFDKLTPSQQESLVKTIGPRSGYRLESHCPGEMPEVFFGKTVPSVEEAKALGEKHWLPAGRSFQWEPPTEGEKAQLRGIICVLRIGELSAVPEVRDRWQLWYKDLFDRQCPAEMESEGEGLVRGLTELWLRHLAEGVHGLSRFTLACKNPLQYVEIARPERDAMLTLRRWVFRVDDPDATVDRKTVDFYVLDSLVAAHARLILGGHTVQPIVHLARTAPDVSDFVLALTAL